MADLESRSLALGSGKFDWSYAMYNRTTQQKNHSMRTRVIGLFYAVTIAGGEYFSQGAQSLVILAGVFERAGEKYDQM